MKLSFMIIRPKLHKIPVCMPIHVYVLNIRKDIVDQCIIGLTLVFLILLMVLNIPSFLAIGFLLLYTDCCFLSFLAIGFLLLYTDCCFHHTDSWNWQPKISAKNCFLI